MIRSLSNLLFRYILRKSKRFAMPSGFHPASADRNGRYSRSHSRDRKSRENFYSTKIWKSRGGRGGARVIAASVFEAGSASVELFRCVFERPPVTHKPPVGANIVREDPRVRSFGPKWDGTREWVCLRPAAPPRVPPSDTDLCAAHKRPSIIIFVLVSATWIML